MNTLLHPIRHFAHEHDDLVAFHAGYLVLAFLSAGLFNLGAFGMLVIAHMALDWVKYRERHAYSYRETIEGIVHENLVDVTLLFVGLVFSVYLHHSVGVASISGLMRAEISIIRATALLIPKLKILHHFLKIVAHLHHYLDQVHHLQKRGWSGLERLCFYFCGLSIFLVLFAAPFMQTDLSTVQHILLQELLPWRL